MTGLRPAATDACGQRALPAGGGRRLRRAYLLISIVFGVLFAGFAALLPPVVSGTGGHRWLLPVVTAIVTALAVLGLAALAALTARSAVHADSVRVSRLRQADRTALIGQAATFGGAAVSVVYGLVLTAGGESSAIWAGLASGAILLGLCTPVITLRQLVGRSIGDGQ